VILELFWYLLPRSQDRHAALAWEQG